MLPIDFDFGARCNERPFLGTARQADSDFRLFFCHARFPTKPFGGGFEHSAQARVLQMRQTEGERIGPGGDRQLVHEAFAGESVRGGGKGPIGAVPQRRMGSDKLAAMLFDPVRRFDGRWSGVDVDEVPGGDRAVGIQTGLSLNDGGGAEVRPGEFFFPCPSQGDWFAGGFRQPRGLHRGFPGMFAAKTRTEVRDDDSHTILC